MSRAALAFGERGWRKGWRQVCIGGRSGLRLLGSTALATSVAATFRKKGFGMQLGVDLTALSKSQREALMKVCTDANAMEMVQAKVRQERIAKFYRDNPPRAIEGIGGITCSIDPYLMSYFRMKYQWDAEEEGEAKEWLMKRNEELRVRHRGLNSVMVVSPGLSGVTKRFSRKYGGPEERLKAKG